MLPLHYTTLNDTPFAYQDEGKGQPLLLIHGSLCDYRYWQAQVPSLSKHFRVIAPSLRHYAPCRLSSKEGFNHRQHAQDLCHLLTTLSIKKAHVLGHSRGAAVAIAMAVSQPNTVASLILADTAIKLPHPVEDNTPFTHEVLTLITQGNIEEGLRLFLDKVSGEGTYQRMVRWFKIMLKDNINTLEQQYQEPPFMYNEQAFTTLSAVPITLITGKQSPAYFHEVQQYLLTIWRHAKLKELSPASHGMNLALPHAFNQIVGEHIKNQPLLVSHPT